MPIASTFTRTAPVHNHSFLPCTQDFLACLALLGPSLAGLFIWACNNFITSSALCKLSRIAPGLKRLLLDDCGIRIDMEQFTAGVRELRCVTLSDRPPSPDNQCASHTWGMPLVRQPPAACVQFAGLQRVCPASQCGVTL